jgi:pimeloyl-ACP methyl ester carboxylesterase
MRPFVALAAAVVLLAAPLSAQSPRILKIDHIVRLKSTVPAIAGESVGLYVRERVSVATKLNAMTAERVVLFVHGAGTPAEVAFDVPHSDYSWMAYLANAGFDVFAMDTTGYGRSVRPVQMNDPCNLAPEQQKQFVGVVIKAPCSPRYAGQLTNIESDWNDINAVVDYIRTLRKVDKVSLVAWSLGGPRAGGYAAKHPEKVHRLVLFAPAYNRAAAATAPPLPNPGTVFNTQSRAEFDANWDRQVFCPNQFDPEVRDVVWKEMLDSDPVGRKWGSGVRRAPSTTTWGWNAAMIGSTKIPTLMIAGAHDRQVPPERVKAAFDDLGATNKVLVDLGCASHNAMWESNHALMFAASVDWLTKGTVDGKSSGVVRMGYPKP